MARLFCRIEWEFHRSQEFCTINPAPSGPVHAYPDFFENGDFFSVCTCPQVSATNTEVFDKRSPDCRFLKTEIYRIRVDGRKRRFSNTMTSKLGFSALGHKLDKHGGDQPNVSSTLVCFNARDFVFVSNFLQQLYFII